MSPSYEFDAYVRAHWQRLVRTAVFLGCQPTEAEDVVQSALLRCLRAWDRVEAARDRDAYVYRVLVNTFRKSRARFWVREMPHGLAVDEAARDVDATDGLAERDALRAALLRLPEDQRRVLVLRFYADLSERQVAAALNIPAGTVKSRASRGVHRMLELLDEPRPGELTERS
jgi:RNA polymerase sigma-70 factor (sigma-E family)